MNHLGTHDLHCGKSMGRHPRHAAVKDLTKRSLASAKISAHLEPVGICQADGKQPDSTSVMPWRSGRVLVWDATCLDTFAPSYLQLAAMEAGAVVDQSEQRKMVKYTELDTSHYFIPVAIETTGVPEALKFFQDLGHHIREESGKPHSYHYLIQRIAVTVQRGNTASVMGTSFPRTFDPHLDNVQ